MYNNVTDAFKTMIRSPSRTFRGRLKINDKWIYANFKKLSYETSSSSEEYLQLGSAVSAKIELSIKRIDELFENTEIPIEIGLKLPSGKYEYIPVGFFTAEHPTNDQATTTFTAYDRMMKTTGLYVSNLTYPASAVAVLNEISAGCGVPVDVSNVDSSIMVPTKPVGYTYREMIGYIASLVGGFACADRTGTIVIKWYSDVDYKLDVTRIMSFEKDESNYNLEKLSCNVDNSTTLTYGGGILGVTFDNPFMTQDRLDNIFKKLSGFSYRGASVKTLGDVRLDPWDMITVEDGEDTYKVPVMNIQQEYDGGLTMTITSYGKTQTEQEVDFKGPTTQQNERIYSDLILAKELIANKVDAEWVKTNTVQAETIVSINNELQNIYNNYLKSETADIKYANIDFSNIGKAAMEYFYAHSGLIKNVVVGDQQITGELIGVTIKGDLIEGNTIVADKLVIKGDDGLYYKLNTDGMGVEAEQTEYNSLNGSIIRAKSITATKIAVDDLVAFGATIAGFNITDEAIYSGVKESALNTTRGIYLDKDGQLAFGDGNNYLRFYKDSSGRYKLEISAESMNFSSTGASVEDAINDINDKVNSVVSVEKSEVTYQVGTSGTVKPTGAWLKDMPSVKAGQFLWTRTLITYSDKSVTELFSVSSMGTKGEKGDKGETGATGIGVKSTVVTYQAGSSGTTAPTGTWSTSVPSTSAAAPYLWTRITIKYTNGTVTNSYSVGSTPEGISVGGRNMAESTNQGTTGWGWSMQAGGHTASEIVENNIRTCKLLRNSTAQSGWSVIEYSRIGRSKYEPNTVYTVSFDVKSNVGTMMYLGLQQGNGTDNLIGSGTAVNSQIKANQWNKLIWIIKTATTLPSSTGQLLYITGMNSGTGVWYQFKNLKIEKGNKATDWSPAPEDIDTKFNNYTTTEQMKHDFKNSTSELYSAINSSFATNGQVSAVDGKFSNYYTKTTIDSTIKQVKDSISLKVSQTDFDKQAKATSASLELKLNKTDNNKVVAMLNASADTISLKSNRFTLDSTYTKIAADGTITCSNLNCTNAKITGGSVNITASSKEENKIILSYQDSSIKLAPYGINLITTKYAFNLTPMKLVMSFSGGGIKSSTTIDPNGVSTGSVKAETIVASSVLKIGPQSYGSNAATGARLEATNQDLRLYASPETTYYVRLGVDYNGSTVKHGWHFGPDGGGSIMLGTSSHAWSNGFFDGTVYIQHGDMHISTGSCYCYDYYYIWSGGGWVELSDWIAAKL